tara:strand:- start:424 stop:798 length:375 start_codon:yes stop_codon:yes gene_type:complete
MKHLYKIDNGVLISSATIINNIPVGMAAKESDKKGLWNTQTLDFDEIPKSKKMVTLDFLELFTDLELTGILDAAKVNTEIQVFVMKMEQASFMDLDYQPTIDGINKFASVGLLTTARAGEILNG